MTSDTQRSEPVVCKYCNDPSACDHCSDTITSTIAPEAVAGVPGSFIADFMAHRHFYAAKYIDIVCRKDAKEYRLEGDWLKPFIASLAAAPTPPKVGGGELDAAGLEAAVKALMVEANKDDLPEGGWPEYQRECAIAAIRAYLAIAAPVDHPEVVGVEAVLSDLARDIKKVARELQQGNSKRYAVEVLYGIAETAIRSALQPSDSPALEAGVAEARVAKLEEVLGDLISWFDKPSEPEWRIKAGPYGADDAVEAARAALSIPAKETGK